MFCDHLLCGMTEEEIRIEVAEELEEMADVDPF
jgi:hypothetical protein